MSRIGCPSTLRVDLRQLTASPRGTDPVDSVATTRSSAGASGAMLQVGVAERAEDQAPARPSTSIEATR